MTEIIETHDPLPSPSLFELASVFSRIGILSFGGPAGQIGMMHRVLVDEKRWISEARFLHSLNYCMLLPGPEAQQLATYSGWLLHGVRGGIIAGTLFILPGFLTIVGLAIAYVLYQDTHWLPGLLFGIKAGVLAIVVEALIRVGKRALSSRLLMAIAACAFLALYFVGLPFPLVVFAAGFAGFIMARYARLPGTAVRTGKPDGKSPFYATAMNLLAWIAVWQLPLLLIWLLAAPEILGDLHRFFASMALVTFGGAYAVLAYVAQVAVETHGWLQPGEMLDGLALAEATPGPLMLVLPYVGFLAAFRNPGFLDPITAGVLGATITAWATFVPSFMFIFAGAPYVEKLRHNRLLSSALSAITAAVVGVILNLSIWFGLHVMFRDVSRYVLWSVDAAGKYGIAFAWPDIDTLDPVAFLIFILACLMVFVLKQGVGRTLLVCAGAGLAARLLVG